MADRVMTPRKAIDFLREAARYFANQPTGGEDRAHWANVYNSENCTLIADMLEKDLPNDRLQDRTR